MSSRILLLIALGALTATVPLAAQDTDPPAEPETGWVVSLGFGTGSRELAAHASLSVNFGKNEIILRTAAVSDFVIFGTPEWSSDAALLYGRRYQASKGWLRAGIGMGVVAADVRDRGHAIVPKRSRGLAVQVDGVWAPLTMVGLGVTLFGNVNPEAPFVGATVALSLGELR